MADYIIRNDINSEYEIKKFNLNGYIYDKLSSTKKEFVFLRN